VLRRVTDIDRVWPLIAKGAEQVRRRFNYTWTLDDIRTDLDSGELIALVDPPRVGFFLVAFRLKPQPHLFGWLVWSGEKKNLYLEYEAQLENMARSIGATYMEITTKRKGFSRKGWKHQGGNLYRKDL